MRKRKMKKKVVIIVYAVLAYQRRSTIGISASECSLCLFLRKLLHCPSFENVASWNLSCSPPTFVPYAQLVQSKGQRPMNAYPSYLYSTTQATWYAAEEDCATRSGHLASIPNGFINALLPRSGCSTSGVDTDYWIGASRGIITAVWSWTDGSGNTYSNWANGNGPMLARARGGEKLFGLP